ncbi:hypothetical protein FAP39_06430 [Shimia litoralis]|uniref:Uncharacterized protein n=1 Tax=Shimia litoralis TaxID=420403 RepID=A0A4V6F206_9RHOB|nr:hypothetical protein [Shimia litoralis]TKZ21371.1 hypothetical protein FAP39_06430 [Shimia litoralis]
MFLELVATIAAAFAAAGMVLLLNRIVGGRLPKWFTPVAAGAAMIVTTISNEYGWYPRTKAALPEGLVISETIENQSFYRPWTYVRPYVERFVAVDTLSLQTHPALPDQRIADVYYFGRWSPVNKIGVLADCANARRAALIDAISFDESGNVSGANWVGVPKDDGLLAAICEVS